MPNDESDPGTAQARREEKTRRRRRLLERIAAVLDVTVERLTLPEGEPPPAADASVRRLATGDER